MWWFQTFIFYQHLMIYQHTTLSVRLFGILPFAVLLNILPEWQKEYYKPVPDVAEWKWTGSGQRTAQPPWPTPVRVYSLIFIWRAVGLAHPNFFFKFSFPTTSTSFLPTGFPLWIQGPVWVETLWNIPLKVRFNAHKVGWWWLLGPQSNGQGQGIADPINSDKFW